ncbi:hypothetical protein C482_07896 [Natrialba chahannaoensis JCM 10990]|uniref:DUF3054 domain-containing protein n=1 Tax=Natrialba chahannaoensis JCM 10990 TaxID=1227492 RepID=M0AQX6_9EURY|nr:DUF3054 domain-containing protein [Natrialba chahannaoensis]ELZ01106.1 hypothetical protein C482_07896 [Natrialba chahannaoensis JCM 10990]
MDTAVQADERTSIFDRETLLIGTVDVALLTALILYGQYSHGLVDGVPTLLEALAPFLLGWGAMAALSGLYIRDATASVAGTARLTALTWIAAANIGLSLRVSPFLDGGAAWPFGLVITGFGLVALVGWRVGYAVLVRR